MGLSEQLVETYKSKGQIIRFSQNININIHININQNINNINQNINQNDKQSGLAKMGARPDSYTLPSMNLIMVSHH